MKKIKLYIAASIDGYIARNNGSIDWLTDYPILENFDYGYKEFYNSVDTIIMGGKSYRAMLRISEEWMYSDKLTYVVSKHSYQNEQHVHFISMNVTETITNLQKEKGKDIWLFGGGEIISLLLNNNLVDEMIITYIPIVLGDGIPLFPLNTKESAWNLTKCETYENGTYQVKYNSN
ncbi:MAG: dihydrofolate reductase family protein [Dysgonomonas sp.]|nr:dihydrofolate reductase family protein [Dysgonomonas sp.]